MEPNPQLRNPTQAEPTERWAKQGSPRGATAWMSDALQGRRMAPPATPMQSVADGLRAGPAPAPVAAAPAPKYTPPPVNPATGGYTSNEQILRNPGVAPEAPGVKSGVNNLAGASGSAAADAAAGRPGILQSARNGLRATGGFLSGAGSSGGDVGKVFSNVAEGVTGAAKAAAPVVGGLARFAAPLGAMYDATKIYGTDTDTYEKRFNLEGREQGLLSDLAVRGAGAAADLANTVSFGGLRHLHDKMNGEGRWDGKSAVAPVSPATPAISAPAEPATPSAPNPARTLRQGALGENDNAYQGDISGKINAAMKSGQTDLASTGMRANDIYKTKSANGTTSYSGYGDGSGRLGNLVSGDGTELRGRGSVSSVPGMSQEAIAQTLRNPDGSTWSAQDNATMAANLRDGASQYQGTSRGDGGGIDQTSLLRLATSPGKVGGSWARQMLRDQMGDQTARRKQDMDMEIAMAPSRLAAQQRQMAATIFKQAGGDNARAGALAMSLGMDPKTYHDALAVQNTARASEQSVAEKFRENGKKEFQVFTDGKLDEQASGQMFDAARRLFPGIESADEKTRNASMADAKELTGIFQKARSQDKVGFDALKFWEPKRAELSGMPDATGGRVETLSGLGGAVTLGASNGDTTLTKNGKTVNLGRLNQRQLELLKTAQQSNWGN